jgi:rod shape-determining protein MreD
MPNGIMYVIIYLFGVVLQFSLAKYAAPMGLFPNVILVGLVFIALARGPLVGQLMGFAWGISWDAFSVDTFGSHALALTCIGFFAGQLKKQWNESKFITQMTLIGIASVLFLLELVIIHTIFDSSEKLGIWNYISCIQVLYNMIIAPVIFWIIDSLEYLIFDRD